MTALHPGHTTPEKLIEDQLDDYLRELGTGWGCNVATYVGPIVYGYDDLIRDEIEAIDPKKDGLFLIIETTGGYIEVAQRIADTLRQHFARVDFVVPSACMSAGTVLAMSGNSIHMDYYSILGPIDPQVQRPSDGALIPALGYLAKYADLVKRSASPPGLTDAEITYLVQRFDPAELYGYEQARQLSISLLKEWLVKHKFRDWGPTTRTNGHPVTPELKQQRAEEIALALGDTDRWHSHSRGISRTVLEQDVNLQIDDLEKSPNYGKLRAYWKLLKGYLLRRGQAGVFHRETNFVTLGG